MYRADAHFRTGLAHEAEGSCCQDYALADNGRLPFAVVSDGCSTSGRTDIGSRLWCLAAADILPWSGGYINTLRKQAFRHGDLLGLSDIDLDATLGFVKVEDSGSIVGTLVGDGVLAAKTPEGLEIVLIEWAGNMPGYPSYRDQRRVAFVDQSEALSALSCTVTVIEGPALRSEGLSARDGLEGVNVRWPAGTEVAAVMSDGVGQVSGLDLPEVVAELLSFGPARQGAFARRRLNAALKRWAKDDHRPVDDISIAALVRVDV